MSVKNFLAALDWTPRRPGDYPYDLDGSLRYTRFKTGIDNFPYPSIIGAVSGFYPEQDFTVWRGMFGRMPFGPGTTTLPLNLQMQITVPGLTKMGA